MGKSRRVLISICMVLLALSMGLLLFTLGESAGRARENSYWIAVQNSRNAQVDLLNAQIRNLQKDLNAQRMTKALTVPAAAPGAQAALADLPNQTALIPVQPALGGTMRFFPELTKILNESYLYAYAEDGHVAADMILRYVPGGDGSVTWTLTAYDAGDGWKLS